MMRVKNISQKGEDGFGHQLLGIMSIISLSNKNDFTYVHYNHSGQFEHVNDEEKLQLKNYIDEFYSCLDYTYPFDFTIFPQQQIMPSNQNNFNEHMNLEWNKFTYVFDNAWSYKDIGKCVYEYNFTNAIKNKLLPNPEFNRNKYNVVIHLRGGDAAHRGFGTEKNLSILNNVFKKIINTTNASYFYFHTNDYSVNKDLLNDIPNDRYKIYNKFNPLLTSFSQMVNADMLIVGDSALSFCASYVNDGTILVPSRTTCGSDTDIGIHPLTGVKNAITLEEFINS